MPLFLAFAVIAAVVALLLALRRRGAGRASRYIGTAAAVWVTLVVLAIAVLTVATLIFGR